MEISSPLTAAITRIAALVAPALLAIYGVTRSVDQLDGGIGPGPWWSVGHLAFLLSVVGFVVLGVQLARDGFHRAPAVRWVSAAALLATGLGAALMCWVILLDLGLPVGEAPDRVVSTGPIVFGVGLVALLAVQVRRSLPAWSPLVVLAANIALGIDLAWLTAAGIMMLVALWPLVRGSEVPRTGAPSGT